MKIHTLRGLKRVSFGYWTTTGPRMIEAGITIDYGPAREITLESEAQWPEGVDFTTAIFEEIRRSISTHTDKRFGGRFTVTKIDFHQIHSSKAAFELVTREAVRSIFSLSQLIEYGNELYTR